MRWKMPQNLPHKKLRWKNLPHVGKKATQILPRMVKNATEIWPQFFHSVRSSGSLVLLAFKEFKINLISKIIKFWYIGSCFNTFLKTVVIFLWQFSPGVVKFEWCFSPHVASFFATVFCGVIFVAVFNTCSCDLFKIPRCLVVARVAFRVLCRIHCYSV